MIERSQQLSLDERHKLLQFDIHNTFFHKPENFAEHKRYFRLGQKSVAGLDEEIKHLFKENTQIARVSCRWEEARVTLIDGNGFAVGFRLEPYEGMCEFFSVAQSFSGKPDKVQEFLDKKNQSDPADRLHYAKNLMQAIRRKA